MCRGVSRAWAARGGELAVPDSDGAPASAVRMSASCGGASSSRVRVPRGGVAGGGGRGPHGQIWVHRGIPGSRGVPDVCRATHRRGGFARIAARSARPDPGRRTATATDRDTHRRQQQQKVRLQDLEDCRMNGRSDCHCRCRSSPNPCESCNRTFCCCCRCWYAVVVARVVSVAGGCGEMLAVTICGPRSRNSAMNPSPARRATRVDRTKTSRAE